MDFQRLFDIFQYQLAKYPQKVALAHQRNHRWQTWSTQECIAEINRVSAGALQQGWKKGDKVAILAQAGEPVWNFLDLGLQQVGVVVVPIPPVSNRSQMEFILRNAEVRCCFVAGANLYQQLAALKPQLPHLKRIVTFDKIADEVSSYQEFLVEPNDDHRSAFQTFKAVIHEDDLSTIIYTSGTSGQPKGVMLSHKNIVSNMKSIISLIPVNCDHTALSFLPLSHIFERMVVYTYLAVGASVYYAPGLDRLKEYFQEVRPHYFTSVPRILEKMYEQLLREGMLRGGLRRRLLQWSIRIGERFDERRFANLAYWIRLRIANLLVFQFWRRAYGNRVQGIVVGAAAMPHRLARIFSAAGLPVREGYGLTETSPVLTFNRFEPGLYRFGTVGLPVPGVEIRIEKPDGAVEGEILAKGPNVMIGYYNQPDATAEVFTEDGWFRTGDVGRFVDARFLRITDRKKDVFKTSAGRYVAPGMIESKLNASLLIDQSLVIGFNRPFVAALIVPEFQNLELWCRDHGVHWTAPQFMVINPKVEQHFQRIIDRINEHLENHEKVRRFTLLHQSWSPASGELTATHKPIRQAIEEKFRPEIGKLYGL